MYEQHIIIDTIYTPPRTHYPYITGYTAESKCRLYTTPHATPVCVYVCIHTLHLTACVRTDTNPRVTGRQKYMCTCAYVHTNTKKAASGEDAGRKGLCVLTDWGVPQCPGSVFGPVSGGTRHPEAGALPTLRAWAGGEQSSTWPQHSASQIPLSCAKINLTPSGWR